jgi:hypothetical protein
LDDLALNNCVNQVNDPLIADDAGGSDAESPAFDANP